MDKRVSRKRVVIFGDNCTGKSCLFVSATANTFQQMYQKTTFKDYALDVYVDKKVVHLSLWDSENYESVERPDVAILCYSIESQESFDNIIRVWLPVVRQYEPKVPIILVANKIDLQNNKRIISYLRNRDRSLIPTDCLFELCRNVGACAAIECSSKTGEGVKEIIETAARVVSTKQHANCCSVL